MTASVAAARAWRGALVETALAGGLALVGWAMFAGWRWAGLPAGAFEPGLSGHPPDPDAWPRLFALWLPVGYGLFTLLHRRLARGTAVGARYLRLDALTYALLPAFVCLELAGRGRGDWRLWLGGAYLAIVTLKAALALRAAFVTLVRPPAVDAGPPRRLARALFVTALGVYALTSAYVVTAVSTTGDEPYYLLVTHSLLHDGDLDLANNFVAGDYAPFYWGTLWDGQNTVRTQAGGLYSITYSGLLAYLLLPGYALGGRLGATLTIAALTALLMANLFLLGWEVTRSRRAAFLTWLGLAFASPVLFFSAQLYPEVPAALAVVGALRAVRRLPDGFRTALPALAVCALSLPLLKLRYALLAAPLLGWAAWRLRRGRIVLLALAGVGLLALGLVAVDRLVLGGLLYARYLARLPVLSLLTPRLRMLAVFAGLFVDQEFGLLPYAPVYVLAALGLPLALRRERETTLGLLLLIIVYAYPFLHSTEWYGGFSLPFRYFVVLVPALGVLVAHAAAHGRGRLLAVAAGAAWLWSLLVALLLTLRPALRYNQATGEAAWLAWLGTVGAGDLSRLFPSVVNPTPETPWLVAGVGLTLLGGMGWVAARDRAPGAGAGESPEWSRLTVGLAALALAALGLGVFGLARTRPTREVQGEHMGHEGRGVFFPGHAELPFKAWVLRSNGSVFKTVRLRGGPQTLTLFAGGYSTDDEWPHLVVRLDARVLGAVDVAAGPGAWRTATYRLPFEASRGRHRLVLEFTNALDDGAEGRVRHLLVDRVLIDSSESALPPPR